MGNRINDVHRRASLVHAQIEAAKKICRAAGEDESAFFDENSPYFSMLSHLYAEDFQLARLWETSDIIVHAEGPAAAPNAPDASVITWLIGNVNKNLRKMVQGSMHISVEGMKEFNLQMTGFAPGSIYAGFAVKEFPHLPLLDDQDTFMGDAKDMISIMSWLPQFIGKEGISSEISEAIEDPILRDSAIVAAYNLSPTGNNGIHTLEFTSPRSEKGRVSQGELSSISRSVLRDAAQNAPIMSKDRQAYGSFIGEFRGVDLDKSRLDLRNIEGDSVNSLRCFVSAMSAKKAAELLGKRVKVKGNYEQLSNGKPRFMRIEDIEIMPEQPRLI